MSKVEELREKVEVAIFHVEDNESMYLAIGMLDSLIAAAEARGFEKGKAEGEKEGQKNAVLRIREHSAYRSNLPEAGYYEVDAELLDEFDEDE